MTTFFMFGRYTADSVKEISPERTTLACEVIGKLGGKVKSIYALLGEYDLVFIVQLPNMTDAMKAAVALGRKTGISFCTAAALPVEEFDEMIRQI
jgi:uncharacterized protein with GYD domain